MSDGRDESRKDPREENRKEALARAVQQIEKSFGKGAIMYLTEKPVRDGGRRLHRAACRSTWPWAGRASRTAA